MPELRDDVVELRPWAESDLPLLERASRDRYVATIEHLPAPFEERPARAWIEVRRTPPVQEFAVVDQASGTAVGGAGFAFRHVPGLAELGYWIVAERRGAGLATRAARLLSVWALTGGGVERLQATVEPWNAASQRVLEHAGFAREGLLRGYAAYRGERQDVYLYALLRSDLA